MLADGWVRVDSLVEINGLCRISRFSRVELDGKILQEKEAVYLMLHKPAGYLSATSDPQHPTVMELIDHPLRDELHLVRLLDRQLLGEAFRRLKRKAAPGIDGVTHSEYAENFEENLLALESLLTQVSFIC